jgi:hypothetical protein
MRDNYAEVILQTCTRSSVDRRKVKDRRLFLKQEYLDHIPERRVNMIDRRMLSDRRGLFSDIMDTFWKEDL